MTEGRAALVLGGTGHIGHALLRELLSRGYRVTAVTRQAGCPAALDGLDVSVVQGDADAPGGIERLVEGADLVVDAAAPYPLRLVEAARGAEGVRGRSGAWPRGAPERARDLARAAFARTERVAEAARRHGAALVFISSFTTLPRPGGVLRDLEARARRAAHPYFVVKEAMEVAVLSACARGLRAVIANPTACLGPWDRKPRSLCYLPPLLSGEIPALTTRAVNVVDVRDVARGALSALDEGLFARPLLLSGHDVGADALSARACALVGRRPPVLRASARVTAAAAYGTEWLLSAAGLPAPFPSLPALLLCEARATGVGESQRALGVLPRPLDETLRDSIAWYRRIGYLP